MDLRSFALAPVLIPQALWTAVRAARLPEAEGKRSGALGTGPSRNLLVLGDSSAAGVGVSHQVDALSGQLAVALARRFSLTWTVVAKSGATVRSLLRTLDTLSPEKFDYVVIAVGVNDTKNGVRPQHFSERYGELLAILSEKYSNPFICASGVPHLRDFPILPKPLNEVLGERSEHFDALLREIISGTPNAIHVPLDFPLDPSSLASDGFHPGPRVYNAWANRVSAKIIEYEDQERQTNATLVKTRKS